MAARDHCRSVLSSHHVKHVHFMLGLWLVVIINPNTEPHNSSSGRSTAADV